MTLKHLQVIILFILRLVEYIKVLSVNESAVLSGIRLDVLTAVKIHVLIFWLCVFVILAYVGFTAKSATIIRHKKGGRTYLPNTTTHLPAYNTMS
jgi:hypothetical protein